MAKKEKNQGNVFWLRSKLGRSFWRFGVNLSPDAYTRFEVMREDDPRAKQPCGKRLGFVTEYEARGLRGAIASIRKGGALEMTTRAPESDSAEDKDKESDK